MAKVVFKPTVQHNVIFTFDDREQEIIDFSFAKGSKSEKLLIDGNFIIPTFISWFLKYDFLSNKSSESSGGNLSFSQGKKSLIKFFSGMKSALLSIR